MKKYILALAVLLIFGLTAPFAAMASDNGLSDADFFYGISVDRDNSSIMKPIQKETTVAEDSETDPFKTLSPGYFFGYINVYTGEHFGKRLRAERPEQDEVKSDTEKSLSPDYFFGYRNP